MTALSWKVARTDGGPYKRPTVFKADGGYRVSQYTTRSKHYPMVRWKAVFPDGRECAGMDTADEAKEYVRNFIENNS